MEAAGRLSLEGKAHRPELGRPKMATPTSSNLQTNGAQAVKTVTGQYLAKAVNYPPRRRAADAAGWLCGQVTIKPTVKLAAEVFGVSVPLVAAAHLWSPRRASGLNSESAAITTLSDDAIDRIVAEVGPERVMCSLDRFTQPQLPLVAAE
jgi:hypothetical protein